MKKGLMQTVTAAGVSEPRDYFNSLFWSGHATSGGGSTRGISGLNFQPDLVIQFENNYSHNSFTYDIHRGGTNRYCFGSSADYNANNGSYTSKNVYGVVSAFASNGITLGRGSSSGYGWSDVSYLGSSYSAYCWYSGNSTSSDSSQDITASVASSSVSGTSIINYTGNNTTNQTVPHGLDNAPEMILFRANAQIGVMFLPFQNCYFDLRSTAAKVTTLSTLFGNGSSYVAPTSTNFTVGASLKVNSTSDNTALAFHSVDNYQKFGTYNGSGTSGNSVTVGFQPKFLVIKRMDSTGTFVVTDSGDGGNTGNTTHKNIFGSGGSVDASGIDRTSTGFTIQTTDTDLNASSGEYFYWAIA